MMKSLRIVLAAAAFAAIVPVASSQAADPEVTLQLAPGVEVTNFTYKIATHDMLKKYKKGAEKEKPVLVFDVTLKNTGDKPGRFQAMMLMPNENKSTGGVIPRNTKKTIAPGAEASDNYVALMYELPKSITLAVQPVE